MRLSTSVLSIAVNLSFASASQSQKPLILSQDGPSTASAIRNANLLFNSIHSAMRQWGSSYQHNGMSFFPSTIPVGTLFYHGSPVNTTPTVPEWLAFEIPHAEMFAWSMRIKDPVQTPSPVDPASDESLDLRNMSPSERIKISDHPKFEILPGYLQTYRVTHCLKVLYIDGMSAANSPRGTLDSTDLLLLNFTGSLWEERMRAAELCALATSWGYDGVIRMECGFELIKCDFHHNLDLLSVRRRPPKNKPELAVRDDTSALEFIRDVSSRYDGIDAGRVKIQYSHVISAFFYTVNITNPDSDPGQAKMPRLTESDPEILRRIRGDLIDEVMSDDDDDREGVDWQGVADMIVKRYAARLKLMSTGHLSRKKFLSEINFLMNAFHDYAKEGGSTVDMVDVCADHYLQSVTLVTEQDYLIGAAFRKVNWWICKSLWDIRELLMLAGEEDEDVRFGTVKIRGLMEWLDWGEWKTCGPCDIDEVCFISFFPYGTAQDHYHPGCRNDSYLSSRSMFYNYWALDGFT